MNRFIKSVIYFTLYSLVVLHLLQLLISFRIHNETTTGHDNLDLTSNINSDLIFLGSSRCWAHFDPHFFQTEFNLKGTNIGVDGHSELTMFYIRLLDYLKHNKAPKYAILNFDPFVSSGNISLKTSNLVHKDNFARYAYRPCNEDWNIIKHFGFDLPERYFPLFAIFKYKQLSNCILMNHLSSYVTYGYEKHEYTWDTLKIKNKEAESVNYPLAEQKNLVNEELKKIKAFCTQQGIKLICIQTPVYDSIFDENIFELPKLICKDLQIPFIDANIESIRKNSANFYNSNHLNARGVSEMNQILGSSIFLKNLLTHPH